jgi:Macro domain
VSVKYTLTIAYNYLTSILQAVLFLKSKPATQMQASDVKLAMRRSPKVTNCLRKSLDSEIQFIKCVLSRDIRRNIIHTVGPIYYSSEAAIKAEQLASCYKTCLNLAVANSLRHIVSLLVKFL